MKKEDLLKLREQINNLSDLEKKERDAYLRKISTGEIYGPMTGYASIDKPWLKYYRDTPIKDVDTNQTMYEMVFDNDPNALAVGYLGKSYTFKEIKDKVDQMADALVKNDVKMGDTILIGTSNSPEALISLLAIDKIGAISKWFDIRAGEKEIADYANANDCRYIIALDLILPKLKDITKNSTIEKIINVNPVNYASNIMKAGYELKNLGKKRPEKNNDIISFNSFLKMGDKNSQIKCVPFDKDRPSVMIQSSGTTGKPKTIVHSDYSVTSCVREIAYSDLPLEKGKKLLVALPPWIAYGLGNAMVLPLSYGMKIELSPNFDKDVLVKYIGKYNVVFAAPFHYRYLREHFDELPKNKLNKFKMVDCMVSGGDKISPEENEDFEKTFGCALVNGYGNNESWGSITVNPVRHNRYGSVGIPKYDEVLFAYDAEEDTEVPYNEDGEICSISNTGFLYYDGLPEKTKDVKAVIHEDAYGDKMIRTGDIGRVDKDGFLFLGGRKDRVIVREGFKISAYTIEDKVTELPQINECVAVSVKDNMEEHVPMIYVIKNDDYNLTDEDITDLIVTKCQAELKEYEIPKYIRVVPTLPYTKNSKYDFKFLEKIGNDYVDSLDKGKELVKKMK